MNQNFYLMQRFLLCALLNAFSYSAKDDTLPSRKCGKVHLTVSSEGTYIELNWVTKCEHQNDTIPDRIALFNSNPSDRGETSGLKLWIQAKNFPDGFYRTKIKFGHPWLPGNWERQVNVTKADRGQHCFPYWIASIKDDYILDSRCLRIQPTWMNDNSFHLENKRIGSTVIPGTHNSGSYREAPTFVANYVFTQDRNIWTQLAFGIRYLDIRVGYYKEQGFYINHDVVRVTPLIPELRQIKTFLELAPKEIVILDFHRFPFPTKFPVSLHRKLASIIYNELGYLALKRNGFQSGSGPTFNDIWKENKNIIICYNEINITRDYDLFWSPIEQHWGDTTNTPNLKRFLRDTINQRRTSPNPLWSLMAEFTPQSLDVIFLVNNLNKLAGKVNRHVTKWFADEWAGSANIIATDFFLGNDIIDVAIETNKHR